MGQSDRSADPNNDPVGDLRRSVTRTQDVTLPGRRNVSQESESGNSHWNDGVVIQPESVEGK